MPIGAFIDNAKVMSKGQITIPKDIREILGVASGDRVTFVADGNSVRIYNLAVYAMQMLQQEMLGEAEKVRLNSDDDIMVQVKYLRNEGEKCIRILEAGFKEPVAMTPSNFLKMVQK